MIVIVVVTTSKFSLRDVLQIDIIYMCVVREDLRAGISFKFERDSSSILLTSFTVYLSLSNINFLF